MLDNYTLQSMPEKWRGNEETRYRRNGQGEVENQKMIQRTQADPSKVWKCSMLAILIDWSFCPTTTVLYCCVCVCVCGSLLYYLAISQHAAGNRSGVTD